MSAELPDDPPRDPATVLLHFFAWLALVLVVCAMVASAIYKKMNPPELPLGQNVSKSSGSDGPKAEDLAVWGEVKGFALLDHDGKKITAQDLRGSIWVANFIFTRCMGSCPQMTRGMADLDKELADLPDVMLISFSMDPIYDKPDVLKKYWQDKAGASPRWRFLTGEQDEMYRLTREEFQLVVKPNDPAVKEEPIIHSSKFVLIDAAGKIRGRFDGLSQDGPDLASLKKLAAAIRKLKALDKGAK